MDSREREKAVFDAIDNGDWERAIEHATHVPPNWDIWQRLPSAAPMPDDVARKVIGVLTHPYGHHKDNLPSFMFEYANHIPQDASPEWLNELATTAIKHGQNDAYITNRITAHPNWKPDENNQSLGRAADFWASYESRVKPEHFATIKAMFTGKPETMKDHRGETGSSDKHIGILPDLKNHAKLVQDLIMNDPDVVKRHFQGKPYIKAYRGVNGHYGKLVRNAAEYHPGHNEAKNKRFILPTAHLSSWTLSAPMASQFAWHRSEIQDQPKDQGVVFSQWIPVDSVLHSGTHSTTLGQKHIHPSEQEIVVGHPEGKMRISTSDMQFQSPPKLNDKGFAQNYGDTQYPTLKKASKIASAVTALAMLGAPQMGDVDPTTIHQENPPAIQQEQNRGVSSIPNEDTDEVNPGLLPIKMIESSGGKNIQHPMVNEGPNAGTSAYGQFGLMPMQIIDTVNYDDHLGSRYPELAGMNYKRDQNKIFRTLKKHPELEREIANSHWKRLNDRFGGDIDRMAYAWLHGITGASHATDEQIKKHSYVKKYHKFRQMLQLEQRPEPMHKKEKENNPDLHGLEKFVPLTGNENDRRAVSMINDAIKGGNLHNISNVGHFTHDSFIAGFDRDNSWLIKVEPKAKSAIKSAKYGLQAVHEVAFYEAANKIFSLGHFTPKAILGEIVRNGQFHPAAAIKMYPDVYVSAAHFEKQKPGSMRGILEKYRKDSTLHKWAIMLYILGDADAHGNNVMTNGEHVKLIDHGTSFADSSFDPGTDKKIYIPFILRGGYIKEHMSKEDKLRLMPKITDQTVRNELKHWVMNLDATDLYQILSKYYIDPKPTLGRLKVVQKLVSQSDSPDEVINHLWVMGFHMGERSDELNERRHTAKMDIVGTCPNGNVYHILTKGGCNIIFRKLDGGEMRVLGKGPHRAMARHMAESVDKSIQWNDNLFKSEEDLFKTKLGNDATISPGYPDAANVQSGGFPKSGPNELDKTDPMGNPVYDSSPQNHYDLASFHSKRTGHHAALENEASKHIGTAEKEIANPGQPELNNMPPEQKKRLDVAVKVLRDSLHNSRMSQLYHSDAALKHYQMSGMTPKQAMDEHRKQMALHAEMPSHTPPPFQEDAMERAWMKANPGKNPPKGLGYNFTE